MKPLVIAYFNGDPSVKILSNFAHTPFVLDGLKYQTVEGFWQMLKTEDETVRYAMRNLTSGVEVKKLSMSYTSYAGVFSYMGNLYAVASKEHHILLERAIRAKIAQNVDVWQTLIETGDRPLKHLLRNRFGQWRVGDSPSLPAIVFERILTDARKECIETGTLTLPSIPQGIIEAYDPFFTE